MTGVVALACCGCHSNVYVRDMGSRPVEGAMVVVQRYSVGPASVYTTNAEGIARVPWGLPGIENISASKADCGAGSCDPRTEPYIVVLAEWQLPVVSPEVMSEVLKRKSHTLTFDNYEGHGNPYAAVYVLDGHRLGKGAAGWEALLYAISQMPKESDLSIGNYYGGRGFPFLEAELSEHARKCGLSLGVPGR